MDNRRFDDFARRFAKPVTRRRTIRGGLGLLAGALGVRRAAPIVAQETCAGWFGSCDQNRPCCDYPDYDCCEGTCLPINTDEHHCGACGNDCGYDLCCDGVCVPNTHDQCTSCEAECNDCAQCELTGRGYRCISSCDPGEACVEGVCEVITCPPDQEKCGGTTCVDFLSDRFNCGGCDFYCGDFPTNMTPGNSICVNGTCVCPAGQVICTDFEDNCVDLSTNTSNCGECRHNCDEEMSGICVSGACQCRERSEMCNGRCCPVGGVCENGVCVACQGDNCFCPTGTLKCDGQCVDASTDALHCGACGVRCSSGDACIAGVCTSDDDPPPTNPDEPSEPDEPDTEHPESSTLGTVTVLPATGSGPQSNSVEWIEPHRE